jgi:hypothetical protein
MPNSKASVTRYVAPNGKMFQHLHTQGHARDAALWSDLDQETADGNQTVKKAQRETAFLLVACDDKAQQIGHLLNTDLPVKIGRHGGEVGGVHPLDIRTGNHGLFSFFLS